MKLDAKGLVILVSVFSIMIVAAYVMGLSHSEKDNDVSKITNQNVASPSLPLSHPDIPKSLSETIESGGEQPRFSHFRVGNRNVKGMLSDGELVWVGTSGGVIRYELKSDNYKLFDVENKSLLSNGVFHLSKLDNKIVVGTYGGGMSIYDPKNDKWRNYNIPDGLADQFVYDVQKVSNGDVWIATWSGVNRVKGGQLDNPESWETFNLENTNGGLPNDWVYGLEEGKNGDMWFATENGLALFRNNNWKNWQHKHGLGADYELVKDDIKFSRDPAKASQHHAQQKVEQGLNRTNVAFNPNYIVSLEVDDNGIVWCGTWGGGLARFDGETWKNYSTKDGLPSNHVFMLHKDEGGNIWAGTSHGLARVKQNGSFAVMTRREGLFADNVFSMVNASDGSMWVGSFGGVARIKRDI